MTRFDRPLPLPGEQPGTIWRPRWRKTRPRSRMPWGRIGAAVTLLAIAGGGWLWLSSGTPVSVVVNGAPVRLRTHSADVAGAAEAAGVSPADVAFADPPLDAPISAGMAITIMERLPVIVQADGATRLIDTASTSPEAIAQEAGIAIGPADSVRVERAVRPSPAELKANPALTAAPVLLREISVIRAATVVVSQNGSQVSFQTTAPTLGEALEGAGFTLYEGDSISPPPDTIIPPGGLAASISPAAPVIVRADGRSQTVRTRRATVGELLGELGLALGGGDYSIPGSGAPIADGMTVRLVRARQRTGDQRLPIPFQTIFVPDPDLDLDQQREVRPGREGTRVRRLVAQLEDGVEVSQVVSGEWVEQEPQARVVAYGVKIVIRTLQTPEGNLKYWRRLRVLATSYSPSNATDKKPGDPRYGLSGTGAVVKRGVVAVDTRLISMGTHLYVPEYGIGTALDVGGAVKGLRVDLGYEDPLPRLWNDWTDLYLLLPVPPPDQVIWVIPAFTPE